MRIRLLTLLGLFSLLGVGLIAPRPALAAGVVGNGTAASCTNAAILNTIVNGGIVTFNCGANPVTIPITQTLQFQDWDTVIDGGNLVTLQGTSGVRIISFRTWGFNAARTLTLRNITLSGASISGAGENANGAALYVRNQSADFQNDLPTVILENVRFLNNTATLTTDPASPNEPYDFGGAAVYILGGVLNVTDSTFTNNITNGGAGGAIHVLGSNLRITNSTFNANSATRLGSNDPNTGFGGAIYVDGAIFRGGGNINITGSTFDTNAAVNQGGAMYVNLYGFRNEGLNITGSRFVENRVDDGVLGFGGAISGGGTGGAVRIRINSSVFQGNRANNDFQGGDGGAIAFPQIANVTIGNSTFYENQALINCSGTSNCFAGRGGALFLADGSARIINSTIRGNVAGWFGGAIIGSSALTLTSTLIVDNPQLNRGGGSNHDQQCTQTYASGGNNIQFPAGSTPCTPGIVIADPLLAAFDGNAFPLNPGSPAINAGNNEACAAAPISGLDQRGVTRPQGDACDVGSYEVIGVAPDLPVLLTPASGATGVSINPTFTWTAATGADRYQIIIRDRNRVAVYRKRITSTEAGCNLDTTCEYTVSDFALIRNRPYEWFVRSQNDFGVRRSLARFTFRTAP
ncbi:MAG: hypothetical protein MUF87_08510 [Anaerolineae bacterium]|jgi:hypothetical protein|nr:hypothetical protein [Anaerolineae bacterium]